MAGKTSVRSRNPVKSSEHRDASPSVPGIAQRSFSSEEEPWDQRPANNSGKEGTMRPYDDKDEDLEDGELPSLTPKAVGGRLVNGKQTTSKPLRPPSNAGLVQKGPVNEQQRAFWGQLDEEPEEREKEEDGPDDEMAARNASRRREMDNASRQGDESTMGGYTFSTAHSAEEQDATFCGHTLTALGEMCGGGAEYNPSDSPPKRIRSKSLPKKKSRAFDGETLEEHTAIEVEFVEPSGAITPQRKNAYLTAMAKKAKDDFEKKKETGYVEGLGEDAPQENIYNTFNAAEKRMFLKLINTGVTAPDASQRILNERKLKEKEKEKESATSPDRKSRRRGLAFWKKEPRSKSVPPSEKLAEKKAPAQVYSAAPIKQQETPSSPNIVSRITPSPSKSPSNGAIVMLAPTEEVAKALTPIKTAEDSTHDYTLAELDSSTKGELPKSGINYYDAVRRNPVEDESVQNEAPLSPKSAGKKAATPRAMKFSALRESRSKSNPRPRGPEPNESPSRPPRSAPPRGHSGKRPDSTFTSAPPARDEYMLPPKTSASAISSSKNVRGLVAVDRESLIQQEDADALDRIEQELLRPARSTAAAIPPAASPRTAVPSPNKIDQSTKDTPVSSKKVAQSSQQDRSGAIAAGVAVTGAVVAGAVVAPNTSQNSRSPSSRVAESSIGFVGAPAVESKDVASRKVKSVSLSSNPVAPSAAPIAVDVVKPASSPKSKQRVEVDGLDVDIYNYLNSTDSYSVHNGQHDSMSVYTAGTGITQSSRVRRPGAAQARLAKAKQAELGKKKGWHDSIQAVAASTNRVWDPSKGWIDYEEPESDALDSTKEKIYLDLDRNALRKPKKDEGNVPTTGGSSVPVPFPQEWEKERLEMLQSAAGENSSRAPDAPSSEMQGANTTFSSAGTQATESSSKSNQALLASKPKGWVESMRAASQALGKGGQKWDPEYGWTSPDQEGASETPDVVDFDTPTSQPVSQSVNDSHEPTRDSEAYHASSAQEADREPRALAIPIPMPPRDADRKLNQWMEKSEKAPKKQSELSTESSDKAVASAGTPTERYMQLGDNGSVHQEAKSGGHKINGGPFRMPVVAPPKIEPHEPSESEDDEAPLLQSAGSFPSITDHISPTMGIVREKVGQEDVDYFAQSSVHSKQKPPSYADEISQSPSRRGAGPVDIDEVDEEWESDDEERQSTGWDADSYPMIEPAKSEDSPSNVSLPTKPVPKLQRSRKDTSPIRVRGPNDGPALMRGESPGDQAPQRGPTADRQKKSKNRATHSTQEGDGESPRGPETSPESPNVNAIRQQWESRAIEEPAKSGATAEWKSFLGKKVRAESAAAARQQGADTSRDEYKERKEPEGDKWNRAARANIPAGGGRHIVETTKEDEDSLFEFNSQLKNQRSSRATSMGLDSSLERSDLSPIRANGDNGDESDSEDDIATSEYGAAEPEKMSFLKRLTECAAPLMSTSTKKEGGTDAMPTAHLAFLRSNPQGSPSKQSSSRFIPANLCGRPDIIEEDEDAEESVHSMEMDERKELEQKPRSKSTPRNGPRAYASEVRPSTSSVVSDDVGSKTAYFEAIAMKAAVSKPRRSDSRRRNRSSAGSSVVSSSSSQHSEKWRAFLDRKKASGASPAKSRASSSTEVSKAAERYAAEKVEEMMAQMATRSQSASKSGREEVVQTDWPSINTSGDSLQYGEKQTKQNKAHSILAAEDLAAARVEAMMAALSSSHLDEGEI